MVFIIAILQLLILVGSAFICLFLSVAIRNHIGDDWAKIFNFFAACFLIFMVTRFKLSAYHAVGSSIVESGVRRANESLDEEYQEFLRYKAARRRRAK